MYGCRAPIVILGGEVPGFEDYAAACRRAAGERVRFLGHCEHDDPLLASAYAACGCLVLASWYETPGLAALEAAMSGAPLVLPWRGCAGEYFGPHARYVDAGRLASIRDATLSALAAGRDPALAELVRRNYSWDAAARATAEGYSRIVGRNHGTKPPIAHTHNGGRADGRRSFWRGKTR
jgi:glycosyltransferase involved in cell wall biosynthesis